MKTAIILYFVIIFSAIALAVWVEEYSLPLCQRKARYLTMPEIKYCMEQK